MIDVKRIEETAKKIETVLEDKITLEITRGELVDLLAARLTVSENELYGSLLKGMAGTDVSNALYRTHGVPADSAADLLKEFLSPITGNTK